MKNVRRLRIFQNELKHKHTQNCIHGMTEKLCARLTKRDPVNSEDAWRRRQLLKGYKPKSNKSRLLKISSKGKDELFATAIHSVNNDYYYLCIRLVPVGGSTLYMDIAGESRAAETQPVKVRPNLSNQNRVWFVFF